MTSSRLPWRKWLAIAVGIGAGFLVVRDRMLLGAPGDLLINSVRTFASLDGSIGEDADGTVNGILSVDGELRIGGSGSITCNDDPPLANNASACPMQFDVSGDFVIETGGSIYAENRRAGGSGGNITANVGGDFVMEAGALISSRKTAGAGDTGVGGDIAIHAAGDVTVPTGAQILADANGEAGAIDITGRVIDIDGLVSSKGSTTLGRGGPISIIASCDLTISDTGVVSSRGQDPGADLVHLEGCAVRVNGLVESTGPGHSNAAGKNLCNDPPRPGHPPNSTACVEIWSGTTIIIDATGPPHNGQVNADTALSGGTQGRGWIDLFANGDIFVLGDTAGPFAVHANQPNLTNGHGGQIVAMSVSGNITARNLAIQADATLGGGDGGSILLEANDDVDLDGASLFARGDFVAQGGLGKGGEITAQADTGLVSWTSGTGDVRPTGTGVTENANPTLDPQRGEITINSCQAPDVAANFPYLGLAATTPDINSPVCGGPPQLPTYASGLPSANCQAGCVDTTPTPTATPETPTPTPTPTGCQDNDDCSFEEVCDTETRICVECLQDTDCDGGATCLPDNTCSTPTPTPTPVTPTVTPTPETPTPTPTPTGCQDNEDCSFEEVCDVNTGICVGCLQDSDCTGGASCQDNTCVTPTPTPTVPPTPTPTPAACPAGDCTIPAHPNAVNVTNCAVGGGFVTIFNDWTQINLPLADVVLQCALTEQPNTDGVRIIAHSIKVDGPAGGSITSDGVQGIQLLAGTDDDSVCDSGATIEIDTANLTDNNANGGIKLEACGNVVIKSSTLHAGTADSLHAGPIDVDSTGGKICATSDTLFGNKIRFQAQGDITLVKSDFTTIGPRDLHEFISTAGSVLAGGTGPDCRNTFTGEVESNMTVTAAVIVDLSNACIQIAENINITAAGTGKNCATDTIVDLSSSEIRNDFGKPGHITVLACGGTGRVDIDDALIVEAGANGGGVDPNAVASINGGTATQNVSCAGSVTPNCTEAIDASDHPVSADPADRAIRNVVGTPRCDT